MIGDLYLYDRLNNFPQKISYSLKPVNVILYGKREFTNVIKLSCLRWRDYLELSPSA